MRWTSKRKVTATIAVLLIGLTFSGTVAYTAFRVGYSLERTYLLNKLTFGQTDFSATPFGRLPRHRQLYLLLRDAGPIHLTQDRWLLQTLYPDISNGFYVDVGSGDGVSQSNTKVLDDLGWDGVCIDPFPTNMEARTAKVFREVVYSQEGRTVQFKASRFLGGIVEHLDHTRDWEGHQGTETVDFTTTTLNDILLRANAPRKLQYMSIDIEGAEFEALKGLSLPRYRVGALTIEHNWEEPKRTRIRRLLESYGYRHAFAMKQDDYYVLDEFFPEASPSGQR